MLHFRPSICIRFGVVEPTVPVVEKLSLRNNASFEEAFKVKYSL